MTPIPEPTQQRMTGTVIVPAYNEAANVGRSLLEIATVLQTRMESRDWEIIVVDDGSVDDTAIRAMEAAAALRGPRLMVRILRHFGNRGLGSALRTGFTASTGDVVVVLDCDLSYHPDHIPTMVNALCEESAQIAVASPYMDGGQTIGVPRSLERRSRLANRFLAALARSDVATFTGMVRAYDGPFIRALALRSTDDMINVEALYKSGIVRGKVIEVPATLDWRGLNTRMGRTSLRNKRSRRKTYETLIHGVLYRPYLPFALGGAMIAIVGTVIGTFAAIMPDSQIGLTVLGVSMMVAGFTALLTSVLSVQVKRGFEDLFHQQSHARHLIRSATTVVETNIVMPDQANVTELSERSATVTHLVPGQSA